MICGKSRSSWLDRLRTAKGIPEDSVTDLEQFLQNPNSQAPETPLKKPNSVSVSNSTQNEDRQMFNIMSNALNELFNYGDKCTNSTKFTKSARKQTNPRICSFTNNGSHENNNAAPGKAKFLRSGDSNSGVEGLKEVDKLENEGDVAARDVNLVGFSRTDVMVIDTSYDSWKFEKLLYRKKNVWKVRDKKGKGTFVGSQKKRKMAGGSEEDQHGGKKWKVDKKQQSGEQCGIPLNEVFNQANTSDIHDNAPNAVVGALKKSQSDLNIENGSSSVILIKSIHNNKKNRTYVSKGYMKSKPKNT
ncbi:hypothetical protein ACS0TY_010526 [Phlomoides rotata]